MADAFQTDVNVGSNSENAMKKRAAFRDRPYQAGRSKHWIKVKNRKHPAMDRVAESFR